jgi:hypothetical protein
VVADDGVSVYPAGQFRLDLGRAGRGGQDGGGQSG